MADNGSGSTNSNSWTILSTEESGVETVGPLSEGQGAVQAEHVEPAAGQPETHSGQLHAAEPPQVAPLEGSDEAALLRDFNEKGDPAPSSPADVETLTRQSSDSGGSHESKAHLDSDLFSDSYTHVSASPETASRPAASGGDVAEERREPRKTLSEESKPDTDETRSEGDGLRRRKVHLLSSLEQHDEEEEEEGEEERFRPPQRDGDFGFSLNKCIFGALVLLGLGTIFFSGVFMDLDDEGDTELQAPKYPEVTKDWLNPDARGDSPGVQPPKALDQLAEGNQQIASLQAQLQQQEVELKTAQQHIEEGSKERLKQKELELENQRMRGELNKFPTLQKELEQENERMKKEIEGLPVLQKELELLRGKVTELTASAQSAAPSAGQEEETAPSQDRREIKDKTTWKKEGKKGQSSESKKHGSVKVEEKESEKKIAKGKWEKQGTDEDKGKQWRGKGERKDWPKAKQDGSKKGKHYAKHGEEKREFKEGKGKTDRKEDKKWKKEQHEESSEGKREKTWKDEKQGKHKSEQRDWKKGRQAEQGDKRWKDKKNGKNDRGDRESEKGNGKGSKETWKHEKGYREREEKHRAGKENDGERQDRWKKDEKKHKGRPYEREEKQKKAKELKSHDLYSDRKHSKVHMHGNYWTEQREKIRHYHGSTKGCADITSCARAEGLAPVSRLDFEAFLSGYLKKLEGSEEQATRNEELNKLIGDFFTDGVFAHDQVPFGKFAEDVGDILEDMAEDAELEDEMDRFEREAMERFAHQERLGPDDKARQSGRKRSSG